MKKHQRKAFTLVELIIVITILAILATIGFMSYQSYTIDARDGKRVTDLGEIRNGLEIYQTKKSVLPAPDTQVTNIINGINVLVYQGYAGTNVLNKIKASDIKDPKENIAYTYSTNGDYTKFQLLSMLENGTIVNLSQIPLKTTYAANNYVGRKTYVVGNKLGVFLDNTTNTPLQETLSGDLNLATTGTTFKVVLTNTTTNSGVITGTGVSLYNNIIDLTKITPQTVTVKVGGQTNPGLSCLDILTRGGSNGNGTYWIKPDTNPTFQVYCDMTTDGGGWTLLLMLKGTESQFAWDSNNWNTNTPYNQNDFSFITSSRYDSYSRVNGNEVLVSFSGNNYISYFGLNSNFWSLQQGKNLPISTKLNGTLGTLWGWDNYNSRYGGSGTRFGYTIYNAGISTSSVGIGMITDDACTLHDQRYYNGNGAGSNNTMGCSTWYKANLDNSYLYIR